jgi:uncharacterized membrane protein
VTPTGGARRPRFALLDAARGLALVAMAVFHTAFDLDMLGLAPVGVDAPGWRWFARLIAGSFLFISGVSLVIAQGRGMRWAPYLRRLAVLVAAAALVTLATWYVMPEEFIFFGILHSLAVASVVGLAFLALPWPVTLAVAALVLWAPFHLAGSALDAPWLRWLGLGVTVPVTMDFEPVFPWLAPFLAGMAAARALLPTFARSAAAAWKPAGPSARGLAFAGRHSLAVYLLHQPLIYGTLSLVAWLHAPSLPMPAPADRPFLDACQEACLPRNRDDAAFCASYCACTAARLKADGLWADVLADRVAPKDRDRMTAVFQACATHPAGPSPSTAPRR